MALRGFGSRSVWILCSEPCSLHARRGPWRQRETTCNCKMIGQMKNVGEEEGKQDSGECLHLGKGKVKGARGTVWAEKMEKVISCRKGWSRVWNVNEECGKITGIGVRRLLRNCLSQKPLWTEWLCTVEWARLHSVSQTCFPCRFPFKDGPQRY